MVSCTLRPARENTGIIFHATTSNGIVGMTPTPDMVTSTGLATTLSKGSASISTVEHLLGALRGLGIDNVHIDVDGREIPVLDGSAAEYVEKISEAGIVTQNVPKKVLRFTSPFSASEGIKSVSVVPHDEFIIDYTIDFPHPLIGRQRRVITITPETFRQVAKARTFGFLKDVEMMRSHGLALGGSLDNAIVIDDNHVLNEDGLRYPDEFVRHKILDFIGDMAVLPLPVVGHFTVICSGHGMNNQFARRAIRSGKLVQMTCRNRKPWGDNLAAFVLDDAQQAFAR